MKLREFYETIVELGMEADSRSRDEIEEKLEREKEEFENLDDDEKEYFDKEKLSNPYSDTRILYGDDDREINSIMLGIDIGVQEILLADRLREKGQKVDLVLAHHPSGGPSSRIAEVMDLQADRLHQAGVPINIAEDILAPRIKKVERKMFPLNHNRVTDAARQLDIPLMSAHTPGDNHVTEYLTDIFEKEETKYLKDVLDILNSEEEYRLFRKDGNEPKIFVGDKKRRAGKIYVDMTGGTTGSKEVFENLANSTDIGTVIGMHIPEKHRKQAEENHINLVIAGHICSDNMGMNLLMDNVFEKMEPAEIIEISGFRRVSR